VEENTPGYVSVKYMYASYELLPRYVGLNL